jgi:hypothetical protein
MAGTFQVVKKGEIRNQSRGATGRYDPALLPHWQNETAEDI